MKFIFAESLLTKLKKELLVNPSAIGIELTSRELMSIYDELLAAKDSNCIFLSEKERFLLLNNRKISVTIKD
jgi:hypothetical protein